MKTIEDLENEYNHFETISDFVETYKDFIAFMYIGLEETYSIEKDYKKEMKKLKREEFIAKIVNVFFHDSEIDFYMYDENIILELTDMLYKHRGFYEKILTISNEDNYKELVKLVDFLSKYYNEHINYFECKRDKLEMYLKRINMVNSKYDDNREVLYEFADKKINIFDKEKVYSKKISE